MNGFDFLQRDTVQTGNRKPAEVEFHITNRVMSYINIFFQIHTNVLETLRLLFTAALKK